MLKIRGLNHSATGPSKMSFLTVKIKIELLHNKTNKMTFAPCEDFDQLGQSDQSLLST